MAQAEFVIESGKTVETVLKVAREKKVDLITMGIRSTFLPGFHLRTSVAYRVMVASEYPVVTVPVIFSRGGADLQACGNDRAL